MEKNQNIVQNSSKAYGYNYASLSDIASQGFTIPMMKTGTDNGREYVYYYDAEIKDWIRGSEIIIPENIVSKEGKNKMNAAQLYGSALTYARRYTTMMALCLACEDDKKLENTESARAIDRKPAGKISTADLCIAIEKLYSEIEIKKILDHYNKISLSELDYEILDRYYRDREKSAK